MRVNTDLRLLGDISITPQKITENDIVHQSIDCNKIIVIILNLNMGKCLLSLVGEIQKKVTCFSGMVRVNLLHIHFRNEMERRIT